MIAAGVSRPLALRPSQMRRSASPRPAGVGVNRDPSVSYYGKGDVAGLLLDARIQRLTSGRRCLDDVGGAGECCRMTQANSAVHPTWLRRACAPACEGERERYAASHGRHIESAIGRQPRWIAES